jgi:hypothetical protein
LAGGLLARGPVQVAQHQRGAVPVRQAVQLAVECVEQLAGAQVRQRVGAGPGRREALETGAPGGGSPELPRGVAGHAVEPARRRLARTNRPRVAGQPQEGRLKGVFGVRGARREPAAHAPDHRPVAAEQGGEGLLVTAAGEALEQFPVRGDVGPGGGKPAEVPQDGGGGEVGMTELP